MVFSAGLETNMIGQDLKRRQHGLCFKLVWGGISV